MITAQTNTLDFFDCSIGIGGAPGPAGVIGDPEELLRVLGRYRIQKALVYDRGAVEAGDLSSFDNLLAFCKHSDAFVPMIPAIPPACGEQPTPSDLVAFALENGIGAVGLWPRLHHFDMNPRTIERLLRVLEEHRIPVIYHTMAPGDHPWLHRPDWRGLESVALAFPGLPFIVSQTGMLQGRRILPLLEICENVIVDLSCQTFGFIEFVVNQFGPERLVCASRLPYNDPGLMTTHLLYADLAATDRRQIAFENANTLIGAIR